MSLLAEQGWQYGLKTKKLSIGLNKPDDISMCLQL